MRILSTALVGFALLAAPAAALARTPYWASLGAGEVMMRKGPGRNFPADWLFKRRGLPVEVVKVYKDGTAEWRRIRAPDGTEGWVQANLLSRQRTALVTGGVRPLRERPDRSAPVVWRAEPGVVGRLSRCARGWCNLDVGGRQGFVEVAHLHGVGPDETLP
jgi:SH3-like domain-containing protein